jgi:hypothetical protein
MGNVDKEKRLILDALFTMVCYGYPISGANRIRVNATIHTLNNSPVIISSFICPPILYTLLTSNVLYYTHY